MLKAFVQAARLRTLPLAIASISAGAVLANYFYEHNWLITGLAFITAILLQILSNFANDYGDYKKGTDEARTDRALASGKISEHQMRNALIVTSSLTLLSGVALLWFAFDKIERQFLALFLIGLISIAAAIKYTAGKNPYGYSTLGDLAVFVFFGLVAVLGTYYLHSVKLDHGFYQSLLPACSLGLLATGVLNINNIRDIEGDLGNGKITLAVKLGKKNAEVYQLLLNVTAVGLLVYFVRLNTAHGGLLIAIVGLLFIAHWIVLRGLQNIETQRANYNKLLKTHVLLTLLMVLTLAFILT